MIQNSIFKINRGFRVRLGIYFRSGRGLRSARMFDNELRASAGRRLRPAAPFRAQIQDSVFNIQN